MARTRAAPRFETRTIDDLVIDDEGSFAHVALYADLKEVLRRDRYAFRVMPRSARRRWDRALFLNLTFWGPGAEGDILVEAHLAADVVAHVAWHHLAAKAFAPTPTSRSAAPRPPSFGALVLAEGIASAFDVYLIGRLLGHAPRSSFLETQVSAMAETASAAGMSEAAFGALLAFIARDPGRAFEDLRQLLFDATHALRGCSTAAAALSVLASFDAHRFGPILHRYELSNWLLYARAVGAADVALEPAVRAVDRALRRASEPLEWLAAAWVEPHLAVANAKKLPLRYERRPGPVLGRRLAWTR
jgi:hypothetical protein